MHVLFVISTHVITLHSCFMRMHLFSTSQKRIIFSRSLLRVQSYHSKVGLLYPRVLAQAEVQELFHNDTSELMVTRKQCNLFSMYTNLTYITAQAFLRHLPITQKCPKGKENGSLHFLGAFRNLWATDPKDTLAIHSLSLVDLGNS